MFAVTVSDRDPAACILPEIFLLQKDMDKQYEALIPGLEQYASFAEDSNIAKAVDDALHAETEGIHGARLGKALFQIVLDNPFTVPS
jgi:hypothetical protein